MTSIDWDARSYPGSYQPVQLDPDKFKLPCACCDWWNRRSWCCCCCFPCIQCVNGLCNPCLAQRVDASDPQMWKRVLDIPTKAPEEMSGLWWLQDNIAAEALVNFNDGYWEDKDDGTMYFYHDLPQSWTRDYSIFGLILGTVNSWTGCRKCNGWTKEWQSGVPMTFNFEKGKVIISSKECAYKMDENEWQKITYRGALGQPQQDDIKYMYRWRRVMRGDGSTTPAWDEMKEVMQSPLPKTNVCSPWCPFWPMCISKKDKLLNMTYPNRMQVMIYPPELRRPAQYSGCCLTGSCSCPCMWPCCADIHGRRKKNFLDGPGTTTVDKDIAV